MQENSCKITLKTSFFCDIILSDDIFSEKEAEKMTKAEKKRYEMLNSNIPLLVSKLAVPTIITMLISAFYNMADTYFIGELNDTLATASVGVAMPLMNIVQAIGFFFGHGSGNYMSHALGRGDTESAEKMSDTSLILSFSFGVFISVLGFVFIEPFVLFLGATELIKGSSAEYISILLIGVPFIMSAFTMNNQIRFKGNAFSGMIGMAAGSLLNVILDPIFITILKMGVKGAAIATVISQIISFIILLFITGRVKVRKIELSFTQAIFSALFRYGTPSLMRQAVIGISAICMNNIAKGYDEPMIAAISIVQKITWIGVSVIIGFGQGFQPVCGFNIGAERYDRVRYAYKFCTVFSSIFMLIFGAVVFMMSDNLISVFRDDPLVIADGTPMLRFQCITAVTQGIIVMTNMLLQNMGKTFLSSFFAMARQGLFYIPIMYIFSSAFGMLGIWTAQSAADVLTALLSLPAMFMLLKELREKEETATI